jgi:hypothetical protein
MKGLGEARMKRFCGVLFVLLVFSVSAWAQHEEGKGGEHGDTAGGHYIPSHSSTKPPVQPHGAPAALRVYWRPLGNFEMQIPGFGGDKNYAPFSSILSAAGVIISIPFGYIELLLTPMENCPRAGWGLPFG